MGFLIIIGISIVAVVIMASSILEENEKLRFIVTFIFTCILTAFAVIGILSMGEQKKRCPEYEVVTEHLYRIK